MSNRIYWWHSSDLKKIGFDCVDKIHQVWVLSFRLFRSRFHLSSPVHYRKLVFISIMHVENDISPACAVITSISNFTGVVCLVGKSLHLTPAFSVVSVCKVVIFCHNPISHRFCVCISSFPLRALYTSQMQATSKLS